MRIGAIVQARMSSRRLPGKSLHTVAGRPLLQYLLERLERCPRLDAVVVATSRAESDDPIARFCEERGVACHRGPLEDVAGRFRQALDRFGFDAFVRVNGDSPLLDFRLVERALGLFLEGGGVGEPDLVTNVLRRSFPRGQSVEVLRGDAFRRGQDHMTDPQDLEHVTRWFYRHPEGFRLLDFTAGEDCSDCQLSVDTPEDLALFTAMVEAMDRPHPDYTWREIVDLRHELAQRAAP